MDEVKPRRVRDRRRKYTVRDMSEKEEKIALEYVKLGATPKAKRLAYLAAGYAPLGKTRYEQDRAHEILSRPQVKERCRLLMEDASKKTILSVAKVLDNYNTIYEKAIKDGDYTAALRSMELYGKHLGLFIERTENVNRNFSFKTTEEVDREIERLAALQGLKISKGTETKQ